MEISKIPTTVRNVQGWYEKSVVRTVRKIHGTKRPRYEKSGNLRNKANTSCTRTTWRMPYGNA